MGIDPVTHTPRIDLLDLSSIIATAIRSHPILGLSTLLNNQAQALNPESLRLISTLLALKQEDPNANNSHLQNEEHAQIQAQMDTLSQLLQPNDEINNNTNSSMIPITNFVECSNSQENMNFLASNLSGDDVNHVYDDGLKPKASDFGFESVITTPKSSPTPLNSSSTCINNSCNEDERDSFCSNFLQFEIPQGLDFADFM